MVIFKSEWGREYKQQQEILSRGNAIIEFSTRIPVLVLTFECRYSELSAIPCYLSVKGVLIRSLK